MSTKIGVPSLCSFIETRVLKTDVCLERFDVF
ncbi:protein of unknown function [Nitrospina watsonii]|uniref:Uncharacterized protein n=1 Tax=Nitrospina watsonii TaxID=1323948 RepID=A0ABN8VVF7_9BACT|nr:protein of unknown function [Nitrospina watsonii]